MSISSKLTNSGQEFFDQKPINIPIKFERPIPLHLRIRSQIIQALSAQKELSDIETPEEADDFSIDDDPEVWNSPYEGDFDHINKPLSEVFENNSATNEEFSPHEEAEVASGDKPEA